MQTSWINKENNKELIVIFNGWGMNETPYSTIKNGDFDILLVSDYRDLNFDFSKFEFEKYEKKYLIAWSMGVYAVNLFKQTFNNFDKKVAVNGTLKIVDDNYGIPKRVYTITARLLSDESVEVFVQNMFNGGSLNPNITITREIPELRDEMFSIQKIELKENLDFDKIIISNNDRIVPTKNQINFWQNKMQYKNIEIINSTHCPFEIYTNWQEIIN